MIYLLPILVFFLYFSMPNCVADEQLMRDSEANLTEGVCVISCLDALLFSQESLFLPLLHLYCI